MGVDSIEFGFKICAACGNEFKSDNESQSVCDNCLKIFKIEEEEITSSGKPVIFCKCCGRPFSTRYPHKKYCSHNHFKQCVVCGKSFKLLDVYSTTSTCSKQCKAIQVKCNTKKTNLERYGVEWAQQTQEFQERVKKTNLERYGVENVSKSKEIKKRITETNLRKYGVEWVQQSPDIREKSQDTMQDRYGVSHALQSEEIKDKATQTMQDRYGVDHALQSEQFQSKKTQTNLERYGVEHPAQSEEFKEKSKRTNLERYGVENAFQSEELQAKQKQTMQERYGVEHALQSEEFQEKQKQTNLERYGVEYATQSAEIQQKIQQTNNRRYRSQWFTQSDQFKQTSLERYGVEYPMQSDEVKERSRMHWIHNFAESMPEETREQYLLFMKDPQKYIQSLNASTTASTLSADLGYADPTSIWTFLHCHPDMYQYVTIHESQLEKDVREFVESLIHRCTIQRDRSQIHPYELDIWDPSSKIGIEVNGTFDHNSSLPGHDGSPKSHSYHKIKTDLADKAGIRLIHVFEHNWIYQKDIVKSMLRNAFGMTGCKLHARKLEVKEVDTQTSQAFLNANHIQGSTNSSIRLGLFSNNSLVSLMTFNKMRTTIGSRSSDTDNTFELARFCSLLNTSIVGGASKLFKHFIDTYHPDKVVSFSNRSYTTGGMYRQLGFQEISTSDPGYTWVHSESKMWLNRVTCQKSNLQNLFKDDSIDLNKTEQQIMMEHGFVQVFDSGVIRWERTQQ